MWDEITYLFQNLNGPTVEIQVWKNNFTHHKLLGVYLFD